MVQVGYGEALQEVEKFKSVETISFQNEEEAYRCESGKYPGEIIILRMRSEKDGEFLDRYWTEYWNGYGWDFYDHFEFSGEDWTNLIRKLNPQKQENF